ncbi:MAG: hypothetical protein HC849_25400 [Oscillatoriales cyanobacterium RU_3_3]|nr:hypothetical protein [Oscillatoriales cyanobacterium RU_3_3]
MSTVKGRAKRRRVGRENSQFPITNSLRYAAPITQLSTVNCQLSTVNCQLSTVN